MAVAQQGAQPAEAQQLQLQQAFPPPPPFYRSFGPGAGSSEGAQPVLPPPPPPPVDGEYQLFGELYTTEDGIPPLTVRQLFTVGPDGCLDFRGQLARLNRELLFAYLDLIDCLVERPSAYARAVENVGLLARNMAYLLNALRAHQARATLEHITKVEIADRREAIREFREGIKAAEETLRETAKGLQEACKRGSSGEDDMDMAN